MDFVLIIYAGIWAMIFFLYQVKRKSYDVGSFVLSIYFATSIFSIYAYYDDLEDDNLKDIAILPLVYLLGLILIVISPILRFDGKEVKQIVQPNMTWLNILALICIIPNLINLPSIIGNLTEGISKMMLDATIGKELYEEQADLVGSTGHGGTGNLISVVAGAFSDIAILLAFFYSTLKNKSRILEILLYVSCVSCGISGIAQGSRGTVLDFVMLFVATFMLLKYAMEKAVVRKLKILGFVFLFLVSIPIVAITMSRFGGESEESSLSSVVYYAGQGNLYFDKYGLDDNGIRYGDRTIPLFKRMLGFQEVPHNYEERRTKYPELYINDEVFSTFVGDFAIDFGPVLGAILLILTTLFVRRNTTVEDGGIFFHQLVLLQFLLHVCTIGGIALYPYSDLGGNLKLIVEFFVYLLFFVDYRLIIKREDSTLLQDEIL